MTAISVTAGHIAAGERDNCEECPIALAIMEAIPGACCVYVGYPTATIGMADGGKTEVELPDDALAFIWDFDNRQTVKPFTFELDYTAVAA